jgi:hypothetical protein
MSGFCHLDRTRPIADKGGSAACQERQDRAGRSRAEQNDAKDCPVAKTKQRTEFGDFQTPVPLADAVCDVLQRRRCDPASVVEPTCGLGKLLLSALDRFPRLTAGVGLDVNGAYLASLQSRLNERADGRTVKLRHGDFFTTDWGSLLAELPEPLLVIGNPPWVTNAELGALGSDNLPAKTNFQKHAGLDAITGKSNFDISEWMLIRLMESLNGRSGTLAMLCKTAVARKCLFHAWKQDFQLGAAALYGIDAACYFGASVAACLLVCDFHRGSQEKVRGRFPGAGRGSSPVEVGMASWARDGGCGSIRPLARSGC